MMDGEKRLTISIALCTFNGERFLRKQLDSFTHQTRLPDEVVVSDDGSTDRTLEILETWAKEVPFPVRLQRNPQNLGYARNFQETMKRCTSDLIFLSDQDDWWAPEKLEKMSREFEKDPELTYVAGPICEADANLVPFSEEHWKNIKMTDTEDASAFGVSPNTPGCAIAFRRDLLEKVLPLPDGWPHDMWLLAVLPFWGNFVYLEGVPLSIHRGHENCVTVELFSKSWRYGRNVYYVFSLCQFQHHEILRQSFKKRLSELPNCAYRTHCLNYIAHQEKHFGNRLRIQKCVWNVPLWCGEFLSGRYFRHNQPLRSFLFDLKEGILNALHRNSNSIVLKQNDDQK